MEHVSVFPFSLNNSAEIVVMVRRDGDFYRDLGGYVHGHHSPIHAAARYILKHSHGMIAPSNIERLIRKKQLIPENDEALFREILAKLITLPGHMCIRNVSNYFAYMVPVPHVDPELLNTNLEDTSLHWIRISTLFSVEEYQRFFTAFDLASLSQVNTNMLKQAITLGKDPPNRIMHYVGIINLEDEAMWQYHFEAMILSNCLQEAYRNKEVKWMFYESELPASQELERITAFVIYGWKDRPSDTLTDFLEGIIGTKKILAIGSAANLVCELLGGRLETAEDNTLPELSAIHFTEEFSKVPFIRKNTSRQETPPEEGDMFLYLSKSVRSLPSNASVIATAKDSIPVIYSIDNILCVHGHPEFTTTFVEEMIAPDLLEQGVCHEEDIENMKKVWESMPIQRYKEVRAICDFFILS